MISIPGTHDGHLCHVGWKCKRQFEADCVTLQKLDGTVFIFEQSLNAFVIDL